MAELFKILQPLQFLQEFMATGSRPDGRKFDESRDVLFSCNCIDTADGSTLVKFGTSSVICGITTSLVKPSSDKPEEGIVEIDVRFSQTCSNEMDNPDRNTVSGYVRECIKKVLFHAKVLNMEQLCLLPRKHAWKILLEIVCLNIDGCIADLALLACLSALKKCKLQKYDVDQEFGIITPTDQYENLAMKNFPILSTFAIINNHLLTDPTMNEEDLSDSLVRIVVNPDSSFGSGENSDSIYLLEITGSSEIEDNVLKNCYHRAIKRGKLLKSILLKHTEENDDSSNNNNLDIDGNFSTIKYEKI